MKRILLTAFLLLGSCALLPESWRSNLKQFTPTITFKKLEIKKLTFQSADVDFVFDVQNPNPLKVSLASFKYQLDFEGHKMLEGADPNGLTLAASGSSEIRLPVAIVYEEVYKIAQAVKGKDDVAFALSGEFGFNTPLGEAKVPYQEAGSFPAPKKPKLEFVSIKVDKPKLLSPNSTTGEVQFKIANEHASAIDLKDFNYKINLNKLPASNGVVPQFEPCPGNSEITVKMPITVNLLNLGSAFLSALASNSMDFKIDATLNVNTKFGVLPFTINQEKSIPIAR
jgi:LEA14-like dessication related protein